jgi:hypothetical protein
VRKAGFTFRKYVGGRNIICEKPHVALRNQSIYERSKRRGTKAMISCTCMKRGSMPILQTERSGNHRIELLKDVCIAAKDIA